MHLAIEVSHAGFSRFFCGYGNILLDEYVENKSTIIFIVESRNIPV